MKVFESSIKLKPDELVEPGESIGICAPVRHRSVTENVQHIGSSSDAAAVRSVPRSAQVGKA